MIPWDTLHMPASWSCSLYSHPPICQCPSPIFPAPTSSYVPYPIIAARLAYNSIVQSKVLQYELLQTHVPPSLQAYLHPCPSYLYQVWGEVGLLLPQNDHSSSTSHSLICPFSLLFDFFSWMSSPTPKHPSRNLVFILDSFLMTLIAHQVLSPKSLSNVCPSH